MTDKLRSIDRLATLLGIRNTKSDQISLSDLEQSFSLQAPNERATNRSNAIKDLARLIKDCGSEIHFMVVYEIVKYSAKLPVKDFTISNIVVNQLQKNLKKELTIEDVEMLSNWGNALIDFSYGFDDDNQRKRFTDIFGTQSEEFHESLLARAIGCGLLSLLPSEKQAPGGNSFNLVFLEGLLEASISIFAAQVYYYEKDSSGNLPISTVPLDLIQVILNGLKDSVK